ncbi:hypothetical protein SELMODRAFT_451379 [Selaginella moellendorffii]|uniref:Uncharacterized protein RPD1L7a-1 n=1 Tax=Selaginella moellendorffii TaxID=88036 RepID=D8R1J0_SELML|nr:hypothetical protein SELMODRAFT_451379 [Selaginella moellendorffii]
MTQHCRVFEDGCKLKGVNEIHPSRNETVDLGEMLLEALRKLGEDLLEDLHKKLSEELHKLHQELGEDMRSLREDLGKDKCDLCKQWFFREERFRALQARCGNARIRILTGCMVSSKRSMGGFSGGQDAMTYAKLAVREKEMRLIHRVAGAVAAKELVSKARFQKIAKKLGFRNRDSDFFLRKFRLMFEMCDKESRKIVELTETMKHLMKREEEVLKQHEPYAVQVLRKLLMMAKEGRIPVKKLSILKPCFGFSEDFETTTLVRFPDFFTITRNQKDDAMLELGAWDPALAVTARELRGVKHIDPSRKDKFCEGNVHSFRVAFENNCEMERDRYLKLLSFQKRRFDSPYERGGKVDDPDGSPEARKRSLAVCHEFLSLTLLKRANVRDLAILKDELQLPEDLAKFLRRESLFFAMERLNNYYFVFLREAYHWDYKIEMSPYIDLRRKYVELALVSRKKRPLKRSLLPLTDPRRRSRSSLCTPDSSPEAEPDLSKAVNDEELEDTTYESDHPAEVSDSNDFSDGTSDDTEDDVISREQQPATASSR